MLSCVVGIIYCFSVYLPNFSCPYFFGIFCSYNVRIIITTIPGMYSEEILLYRLRTVFCSLKNIIMAWQARHNIRDKRLQVQDSSLLLKKLWQRRQDTTLGTRGYAFRIVFCCNKKITMARQVEHCTRGKSIDVSDNGLP